MSPSINCRENREFASEIKFLIAPQLAGQVRGWMQSRLRPDPYAGGETGDEYQITSLYFDTEQFDVFHRRGSFGRSKYRVRRYGREAVAFLERKLKTGALLTKRRTVVRSEELEQLSRPETAEGWIGAWYHRRLLARDLKPVCQISYRRTARVAPTPFGPIRLTMDDNLRASVATGVHFVEGEGELILNEQIILEMKFRYAMPALFKYLAEEFGLTPSRVSKYRLAVNGLELMGAQASGVEEKVQNEYA